MAKNDKQNAKAFCCVKEGVTTTYPLTLSLSLSQIAKLVFWIDYSFLYILKGALIKC